MSLADKVVLLSGGAQGIGRETAWAFLLEGAHVIVGDVVESEGLKLVEESKQHKEKESSHQSGSISFVLYDARTKEGNQSLVERALELFQRIDVVINNVGVQPKSSQVPLHELEEEVWDLVFDVNIKSFFWLCKFAIPHMLKQGGSIINIASIQGIQSQKHVSAYAATKGAILSFTRQLAVEYGPHKIRANTISPGSIVTQLMLENTPNLDHTIGNTPLGFLGEPLDVANMAVFLASDKSKWITGQNFVVDGGITIKGGWAK